MIRRRWGIENELHWSLDVTFGEEKNRTANGHAGTIPSLIREVALSPLRQDPGKGGLNWRGIHAASEEAYLLRALQGCPKIRMRRPCRAGGRVVVDAGPLGLGAVASGGRVVEGEEERPVGRDPPDGEA